MKFSKKAARPKDIDLILPGLGVGIGRMKDRFRVSSETYEPKVYDARVAMVKDLANRLLFPLLRARLEGRISTTELYQAYRQGDDALRRALEQHEAQLLQPLLERYLRQSKARGKAKYKVQVERFIASIGGPNRATTGTFTTEAVADFLGGLTNLTRREPTPADDSTKNRYRAALQGFATWLVARRYMTIHPIAYKAIPKREESPPRLPEFSAEDYRRYFAALADVWESDPRLQSLPRFGGHENLGLAFRLLLHTGADVGEIISRRVGDCLLDGPAPRIRFVRSKTRTPQRLVPLPKELARELREQVERANLRFSDRVMSPLTEAELATVHEKIRARLDRPDLRLKDFRHVAAISWRRAGIDLIKVKDWLGHATLNQTMIYAAYGANEEEDAEAAERAAARLTTTREAILFRTAS